VTDVESNDPRRGTGRHFASPLPASHLIEDQEKRTSNPNNWNVLLLLVIVKTALQGGRIGGCHV